eukprot:CAMPEP_0178465662 /NCGR_PEP_ID=MMETSP0689_2-20121128/51480_1 /TAXON_ID=160604 /ORGANISM="Amphidinium massartii, Strain CS-259" /LENGTH=408 /DNA_ID=CAMNT_0020092615 /DNA_START=92 /DNA_END=1315 /DNA_ORIENTATION=-
MESNLRRIFDEAGVHPDVIKCIEAVPECTTVTGFLQHVTEASQEELHRAFLEPVSLNNPAMKAGLEAAIEKAQTSFWNSQPAAAPGPGADELFMVNLVRGGRSDEWGLRVHYGPEFQAVHVWEVVEGKTAWRLNEVVLATADAVGAPPGFAERKTVRAGDEIVKVNGKRISSKDSFEDVLMRSFRTLALVLRRDPDNPENPKYNGATAAPEAAPTPSAPAGGPNPAASPQRQGASQSGPSCPPPDLGGPPPPLEPSPAAPVSDPPRPSPSEGSSTPKVRHLIEDEEILRQMRPEVSTRYTQEAEAAHVEPAPYAEARPARRLAYDEYDQRGGNFIVVGRDDELEGKWNVHTSEENKKHFEQTSGYMSLDAGTIVNVQAGEPAPGECDWDQHRFYVYVTAAADPELKGW